MGLSLSSDDIARFASVQEALLSPFAYESIEQWCKTVLHRAEALFHADRSTLFVPLADRFHYVSESIDPRSLETFERGIEDRQPGALHFRENLVERAWAARRERGIEVWTMETLERLLGRPMDDIAMYHEAIKPAGLGHSVVATTPVPSGEAFLGLAHSRLGDDPFGDPRSEEHTSELQSPI